MKRVLVTGAGGFVGRHTLKPMLDSGFEVYALTSSHPPGGAPGSVRWLHGDLLQPRTATALMREYRPSHLLHLAWFVQPPVHTMAQVNLEWVEASSRLLEAFAQAGGQRALLAGTYAEYTARGEGAHYAEGEISTGPATLYGAAKYALHLIADGWTKQSGVALAWGRVFNIYGPYEHFNSLIATLARGLLRGEEVATSSGSQMRDYLYVSDLADAFVALLGSDIIGSVNMASGAPVQVAEVIAAVAAETGRSELVRMGARRPLAGGPDLMSAEVRRLREEVGWSGSVGLREGIARTVDWWRQVLAEAASR